MGKMLEEVTCSCLGEGVRLVRLKGRVRGASCMSACRHDYFLLTSLAFPYIVLK